MRAWIKAIATINCIVLPLPGFAADVSLPAPVLQWSFYIFLMFALVVAVGIFFVRTKKEITDELLSNLIEALESQVHFVDPYMSVADCVSLMNEKKIGAMLVVDDEQLVGIFTERDILTRVVGAWLAPATTKVGEVMTKEPYCVSPATSLEEAMSIISEKRFRHLPVVENGKVLGMVSSGDLTHRLVSGRSADVRDLVGTAGRRRASL